MVDNVALCPAEPYSPRAGAGPSVYRRLRSNLAGFYAADAVLATVICIAKAIILLPNAWFSLSCLARRYYCQYFHLITLN